MTLVDDAIAIPLPRPLPRSRRRPRIPIYGVVHMLFVSSNVQANYSPETNTVRNFDARSREEDLSRYPSILFGLYQEHTQLQQLF
jgi:hypothetical protein